jgi:hypothetical protein
MITLDKIYTQQSDVKRSIKSKQKLLERAIINKDTVNNVRLSSRINRLEIEIKKLNIQLLEIVDLIEKNKKSKIERAITHYKKISDYKQRYEKYKQAALHLEVVKDEGTKQRIKAWLSCFDNNVNREAMKLLSSEEYENNIKIEDNLKNFN